MTIERCSYCNKRKQCSMESFGPMTMLVCKDCKKKSKKEERAVALAKTFPKREFWGQLND